jgi:hypothetical protein
MNTVHVYRNAPRTPTCSYIALQTIQPRPASCMELISRLANLSDRLVSSSNIFWSGVPPAVLRPSKVVRLPSGSLTGLTSVRTFSQAKERADSVSLARIIAGVECWEHLSSGVRPYSSASSIAASVDFQRAFCQVWMLPKAVSQSESLASLVLVVPCPMVEVDILNYQLMN